MGWSIFARQTGNVQTLTDTLRFPSPATADPATNVKAAVLKAPLVAVPISHLAARRRCKQPPPLNISTFQTAISLEQRFQAQFSMRSARRRTPLVRTHQAIQSAQAGQKDWAALAIEQAAATPAQEAGWLKRLACPSPTAKTIAYRDAIQARSRLDLCHDDAIIPEFNHSLRQSTARSRKTLLPLPSKLPASATVAFRPPPPANERHLPALTRVPSLPAPQNRPGTSAGYMAPLQRSGTERPRMKPMWG